MSPARVALWVAVGVITDVAVPAAYPVSTNDRIGGTGKERHTLRVARIILVGDDRSVTVEKDRRHRRHQPAVMLKPASTNIVSPVIPEASFEARKSVALATSADSMERPSGARSALILRRSRK